jgi:hypothetical protein
MNAVGRAPVDTGVLLDVDPDLGAGISHEDCELTPAND